MSKFSRRDFMKIAGASAAMAVLPLSVRAQAGSRVVVVGGGFGGGAAAKFLRLWDPDLEVVLVEPNPNHVSCIMSNLYYANQITLQNLTLSYTGLRNHGVTVVQKSVTGVDAIGHRVHLSDGTDITYDKLIMSPGISFIYPPGMESATVQARIPHAWKDVGSQAPMLKNLLQNMSNGGKFVMTIPGAPFRCPPGPYERACMVAAYFKQSKPRSKVIVLDANPDIVAEKTTFMNAFTNTYAGMIEYHPNSPIVSVDANTLTVNTSSGIFKANVLNVIPTQKAGQIAFNTGLINVDGRWAGVNVQSFQSTAADDIFVLGDSNGSSVGKSGHFANSEAKLCAAAIIAQLSGDPINPAPMLANACYSAITTKTASWATSVLAYQNGAMVVVPGSAGEAPANGDNYGEMFGWANNLWADTLA